MYLLQATNNWVLKNPNIFFPLGQNRKMPHILSTSSTQLNISADFQHNLRISCYDRASAALQSGRKERERVLQRHANRQFSYGRPSRSRPFAAAKKRSQWWKKDKVRAKLKTTLQLRGLSFNWKYPIIATFPQEKFSHERECLKWLITKPNFWTFKPFYRAIWNSKARNILHMNCYQ